jgi:transposase InsO family protein
MKQHRDKFTLAAMCRQLKVSREGYYKWLKRSNKPSPRTDQQVETDRLVKGLFEKHKRRYGAPRIAKVLNKTGIPINRKTVAESMRRQGLRAKAARKFKATTNSKHNLPVYDNLLEQDFAATAPNQKYVQDITYLDTGEGWVYLAVVIDLYSRYVVGWSMNERMNASLVTDALDMALKRRGNPTGVIVHSDRGSQYCSNAYRRLIKDHKLKGSMSKKGCCYDNACAESFFHSLKVELTHGETFNTRRSLRDAVFEYIEVEYNNQRLHSSNDYQSPAEYEVKLAA